MNSGLSVEWRKTLGQPPVTILLVEDSESFRRCILSILRNNARFQVIAEAVDGLEAVQKATELKPDLILLDLTLPYKWN